MVEIIALELGGQSYELKPDFVCLASLEEAFGRPLLQIADMFVEGDATLKIMVDTLAIILAWPSAAHAELGEEIVAAGIGNTLQILQKFFLTALGIHEE